MNLLCSHVVLLFGVLSIHNGNSSWNAAVSAHKQNRLCNKLKAKKYKDINIQAFNLVNNSELVVIESNEVYKIALDHSENKITNLTLGNSLGNWQDSKEFPVCSQSKTKKLEYFQWFNFNNFKVYVYLMTGSTMFMVYNSKDKFVQTAFTVNHRLIIDFNLNGYIFFQKKGNIFVKDIAMLFNTNSKKSKPGWHLMQYINLANPPPVTRSYTSRLNTFVDLFFHSNLTGNNGLLIMPPNEEEETAKYENKQFSLWLVGNTKLLFQPSNNFSKRRKPSKAHGITILPVGFIRNNFVYLFDFPNGLVRVFDFADLKANIMTNTFVQVNQSVLNIREFFNCAQGARLSHPDDEKKSKETKNPSNTSMVAVGSMTAVVVFLAFLLIAIKQKKSIKTTLRKSTKKSRKNILKSKSLSKSSKSTLEK